MGTLFLFFDGIGVGRDDPASNPFAAIGARRLAPLAGCEPSVGASFKPLDATLGVPGLPQSATGQTTLLTGVNAARHAGGHRTGLPGPTLWPLLERESLFVKLEQRGKKATFANAYTREHLERRPPRWSATTRAVLAARLALRMWHVEGANGSALSHDYTGEWMRGRGYPMPLRSAAQAATVLIGLLERHDLVLYEYFLTDLVAHRGTWEQKLEQARRAEALLDAVLLTVDLQQHRVLLTSDHGNLEHATDKRHTLNPVPLLAWGAGAQSLMRRVNALTDVTPALV